MKKKSSLQMATSSSKKEIKKRISAIFWLIVFLSMAPIIFLFLYFLS